MVHSVQHWSRHTSCVNASKVVSSHDRSYNCRIRNRRSLCHCTNGKHVYFIQTLLANTRTLLVNPNTVHTDRVQYQSECVPSHVRGAVVCCYQLFITIGILIANLINFGTESLPNTGSWRIVMAIGWLFALVLGVGILFFPETPRFEARHDKIDNARASMAKFHGVSIHHRIVNKQMDEMAEKLQIEREGGDHPWYEVITGPRMTYRILLGVAIQALQQLTGANYFFYYGTTVFQSVGLSNSFVTQIILGAVNVACTFPGLYFVDKFGRRKCLMTGALWQTLCFLVFASLGRFKLNSPAGDRDGPANQAVGYVMIVFACLFIASFASTWGPMAWAVTSEIYPTRYRSEAMSLCSASNWTFNFLLAFFTPFIDQSIYFAYGYVFAGCNLAAFVVVFLFLGGKSTIPLLSEFTLFIRTKLTMYFPFSTESKGRSLEEVDTMYLLHVSPMKSSTWEPPAGEDLVTADNLALNKGARGINKKREAGVGDDAQIENTARPGDDSLPDVPIVSGHRYEMGAGVRGNSYAA